ncbi:restriction endonuclease [Halalkaliarchaeum desulfuricum]|uniref:Restriction endonuclease n=1 Tax=Halalkaliarchaeum desulfuricum TaxID=2055893 RepID=A0A343TL94_9EURY|nr:SWIM zinc finger family protein [Halalkaliarchaeum desulfuricum]AUX09866.1 restriction endonuclease [Halalkaliarchaeum desulfuricum]
MVDRRRQWRAENQDIFVRSKAGKNTYIVNGNRGINYEVDISIPVCECPDWKKNQPGGGCKHILKVKLKENIIEPLPSAKTNFGTPESRSPGNYAENWDELRIRTLKQDKWECQKCGKRGGPYGNERVDVHHIVPKSKGGEDRINNLITLCHSCHEKEHGHTIPTGKMDRSNQKTTLETQKLAKDRDFSSCNSSQEANELNGPSVSKTGPRNLTEEIVWTGSSQEWWHFVALANLYNTSRSDFRSKTRYKGLSQKKI